MENYYHRQLMFKYEGVLDTLGVVHLSNYMLYEIVENQPKVVEQSYGTEYVLHKFSKEDLRSLIDIASYQLCGEEKNLTCRQLRKAIGIIDSYQGSEVFIGEAKWVLDGQNSSEDDFFDDTEQEWDRQLNRVGLSMSYLDYLIRKKY